jgi:hypothetical protein
MLLTNKNGLEMKSYPHNFLFSELLQTKGREIRCRPRKWRVGKAGKVDGAWFDCEGCMHIPQMEETGFRIVEVAITGQAKERSGKISEFGCGGRTCSG